MYTIQFTRSAVKEVRRLPLVEQKRIYKAVVGLQIEPIPPGAVKLTGTAAYRLRVGVYRIIYELQRKQLIIRVIKIGHRKHVYKNMNTL